MLKKINSSQQDVSLAKHLLLVSPEEWASGSDASPGSACLKKDDLCGNAATRKTLPSAREARRQTPARGFSL